MELTLNTPALLFPAISLIMLAYTNRFLGLSNLVRTLHDRYRNNNEKDKHIVHAQIRNIKIRIRMVKNMQILGVLSMLIAIISMYLIYIEQQYFAKAAFATSLLLLIISLLFSLLELFRSTKSLELELSDMDKLEEPGIVGYIKDTLKG